MKPSLGKEPHLGTRKRLAERLQRGAAWTVDLRREPERYGCNPADWVYELRKRPGWDIRTLRAWIYGRDGLPTDYRDYYVLVRGSKWNYRLMRWEDGKPVLGSMLEPKWRAALLKAWKREP